MPGAAVFSADRMYRYVLRREWMLGYDAIAFVMLNPSTADDRKDDATVRRCIGFARAWGYKRLTVVNLFALRSTNPKGLTMVEDPIGPQNDAHIVQELRSVVTVVAAWGPNGTLHHRDRHVLKLIADEVHTANVLRLTKGLHPSHPLRLPKYLYPHPFTDLNK